VSQPEAGGGVPGAGEPATGAIDDAGGPRPPRPAPRTTGGHRLIRTAGLLSAATMLSRLLGLVREQLFAALLGASLFAEAFIVAFRIPNLLRDLFAEGALSQAFVPTFKASLKRGGTSAAYLLGNRVAGTLLAVIAILTIVAAAGAPEIVQSMAGTFADTPGKFELAVILTRIMLPFLAMVSLAAVAMGMLNAQDRYATPALAPATFNLVCITIGLTLWGLGLDGRKVAIGWAIGTLLGGAAQLGIQMPTLWRQGWRPRLGVDLMLRDPHVRHVAALMVPAVAGLAAVQVNVFVNTIFATQEAGAAAWLNYAFRFLQLPIGVFGVAIATVTTTRYADAAADGNRARMAEQLAEGLRLVAFLTVPATVGLVVLGEPIIQLIYQHGRFGSADTPVRLGRHPCHRRRARPVQPGAGRLRGGEGGGAQLLRGRAVAPADDRVGRRGGRKSGHQPHPPSDLRLQGAGARHRHRRHAQLRHPLRVVPPAHLAGGESRAARPPGPGLARRRGHGRGDLGQPRRHRRGARPAQPDRPAGAGARAGPGRRGGLRRVRARAPHLGARALPAAIQPPPLRPRPRPVTAA